jgi:DNA-binding transcriptional regulator YhcF (GntR family)
VCGRCEQLAPETRAMQELEHKKVINTSKSLNNLITKKKNKKEEEKTRMSHVSMKMKSTTCRAYKKL